MMPPLEAAGVEFFDEFAWVMGAATGSNTTAEVRCVVTKFVIVIETGHGLPDYASLRQGAACVSRTSIINPPPENFQCTTAELPRWFASARAAYPLAFVAAHEVKRIDLDVMRDRWARKHQQSAYQSES